MRQQDYSVRHQLERFRSLYEAGGQRFDLIPCLVDTGFDTNIAFAANTAFPKITTPGKDFPFLWIGVSFARMNQAVRFQPSHEKLFRWTVLKNGVNFGNDVSINGAFTLSMPSQTTSGYNGKPWLLPYPYLFEAHDAVEFDLWSDSAGAHFHQVVMHGYKILPRG